MLWYFQDQQEKIQRGAGLQADGLLSEVGNNGNAFSYAASWVLELILGGPTHLWSDAEAWPVSLNDNKPSYAAAGQEEELCFTAKFLFRRTHSRHEGGTQSCLRAACSHWDEASRRSCLTSGLWLTQRRYHSLKAVINTRQWLRMTTQLFV